MKVVLDTNVLLKSLPKTSPYRPIFDAIRHGKVELLLSTDILLEYTEILEQRTTASVSNNVANLLVKLPSSVQVEVYIRWNLIQADLDDNKFTDCAVAGNATFLVTDDKHFNVLSGIAFPPIEVCSSDELLTRLKNRISPTTPTPPPPAE
ncbi:putative toxin-antitoxin system toxin component, PIN family [Neolewinella sp.]|uniref:putative toxin-antitoxin system toxin component, PIN family n=1 Tax=Neolewinella sp. TaxID=2993543 RepID=UPI003B519F90